MLPVTTKTKSLDAQKPPLTVCDQVDTTLIPYFR